MPTPAERTRSKKRVKKALPGGNKGMRYRERIAAFSRCSLCGQPLAGSGMSPLKAHKLNRGKRRIWRQNGGQLCHNCLKKSLRQAVRTL